MNERLHQAATDVFSHPAPPAARRHGPRGYTTYHSYKPWLRDEFEFRCVYCLCRERWEPNGADMFSVEHLRPQSAHPDDARTYENLLYACNGCNSARQDAPLPFDPSQVLLREQLQIATDGVIRALTDRGAELIDTCRLNRPSLVGFRRRLIQVLGQLLESRSLSAEAALRHMLGFPDDLPDLAAKRPPTGNTRPEGIAESAHERRRGGQLPEFY